MTLQIKTLYGVIAILIALVVISSTLSAYYYSEDNQVSANNTKIENELQAATTKYSSLATQYNSVLTTYNGSVSSFNKLASIYNASSASFLSLSRQFNLTFSLLVSTVYDLNTSEPAYVNASKMLSELWSQYIAITTQYKQLTSTFENTLASFESANNVTISENIQPVQISLLTSNILIYFDNGTADWFNNTSVEPGWNFYVATLVVTNGNVNATCCEYGSHFVTGIDGVMNSNSLDKYWFLWAYNSTSSWQVAQVGADQLVMFNGSTYAWTYCKADVNFNPECTPP